MSRILALLLLAALVITAPAHAAKALFDNAHGEDAGNADWVIDDNFPIPLPAQSGIVPSSPGTYWTGGISSFGVSLVKRGYTVHSNTAVLTYGNAGNSYDLANYDLLVLPEPNSPFTAAESTAIFDFVRQGGGLVVVMDHSGSDRNGDGWDSAEIWNALDAGRLLGVRCAATGDANNNIVQTSTNVNPAATDSITHGPVGVVTALAFHNGTTYTLYPAINPTVRGEVWMSGVLQTATVAVMAASSQYGNGRVVFVGDSSPLDDGTARPGNTNIFDGWGEASDSTLFMNAALWATRRDAGASDLTPPEVTLSSPVGGEAWKAGSTHAITWTATDNVGVTSVDLVYSIDGGTSYPYTIATGLANSGSYNWLVPNVPGSQTRVRITAWDGSGNFAVASSAANFTIDRWTIVASAGAGGSIVPSGTIYLAEGQNRSFAISASAGYAVADVLVDGLSVGAVTSYTFTAVHEHHTIAAAFVALHLPEVTLLSPNGGESWELGTSHSITWSATDNAGITAVALEYSTTGGTGPWTPIASGLANSGAYPWTVPATASTRASIRVLVTDTDSQTVADTSDAVFTILDPNAGVGDAPVAFALGRPAPNPFAGDVRLSFGLPASALVRIDVIDAGGRRVAGTAGEYAAGSHAWRWDGRHADGSHARAGLYFVRLASAFGTRTQRLVRLD